jgi:hypothetical protein
VQLSGLMVLSQASLPRLVDNQQFERKLYRSLMLSALIRDGVSFQVYWDMTSSRARSSPLRRCTPIKSYSPLRTYVYHLHAESVGRVKLVEHISYPATDPSTLMSDLADTLLRSEDVGEDTVVLGEEYVVYRPIYSYASIYDGRYGNLVLCQQGAPDYAIADNERIAALRGCINLLRPTTDSKRSIAIAGINSSGAYNLQTTGLTIDVNRRLARIHTSACLAEFDPPRVRPLDWEGLAMRYPGMEL